MINPNLAMVAGAGLLPSEAEAKRIEYERGRGQAIPTMVIEAVEGGFAITTHVAHMGRYGDSGSPRRSVVPNVDALIGAVNRWHRDGQKPEHD